MVHSVLLWGGLVKGLWKPWAPISVLSYAFDVSVISSVIFIYLLFSLKCLKKSLSSVHSQKRSNFNVLVCALPSCTSLSMHA